MEKTFSKIQITWGASSWNRCLRNPAGEGAPDIDSPDAQQPIHLPGRVNNNAVVWADRLQLYSNRHIPVRGAGCIFPCIAGYVCNAPASNIILNPWVHDGIWHKLLIPQRFKKCRLTDGWSQDFLIPLWNQYPALCIRPEPTDSGWF